jgi:hypothetical protein
VSVAILFEIPTKVEALIVKERNRERKELKKDGEKGKIP